MFKPFIVVGVVHGVVACKDNGKVGGYSDGCIAGSNSYKVIVGVWGLVSLGDEWRMEKGENSHASFTQIKIAQF